MDAIHTRIRVQMPADSRKCTTIRNCSVARVQAN